MNQLFYTKNSFQKVQIPCKLLWNVKFLLKSVFSQTSYIHKIVRQNDKSSRKKMDGKIKIIQTQSTNNI